MGCGSSSDTGTASAADIAGDKPVTRETLAKLGIVDDQLVERILARGLRGDIFAKLIAEFNNCDTDKSGHIDAEELKKLLVDMWNLNPELPHWRGLQRPSFKKEAPGLQKSPSKVFGDVSEDDMKARLKKLDVNSDGMVSRDEYLRYMITYVRV